MRKIISYLTLFSFLFCSSIPVQASDKDLREKIQRAMEDHVVLEVTLSRNVKHTGYVVETTETAFVLLDPLTKQTEQVTWGGVKEVKQVKTLGPESKSKIDKWVGKDRTLKIELLDGSKVKGRVAEAGVDSFLLRDPKKGTESTVFYDQVKKVDDQPTGQKVVRNVMIGTGIGLLALYLIALAYIDD